jgi:pilus assembly protein Flp/PilA
VIRGRDVMNDLQQLFSNLLRDESGQDLIEYALVAALIGLGATATMRTLAISIGTALTGVGTRLTNAV